MKTTPKDGIVRGAWVRAANGKFKYVRTDSPAYREYKERVRAAQKRMAEIMVERAIARKEREALYRDSGLV